MVTMRPRRATAKDIAKSTARRPRRRRAPRQREGLVKEARTTSARCRARLRITESDRHPRDRRPDEPLRYAEIEAAGGEHGKGFAGVDDEVRRWPSRARNFGRAGGTSCSGSRESAAWRSRWRRPAHRQDVGRFPNRRSRADSRDVDGLELRARARIANRHGPQAEFGKLRDGCSQSEIRTATVRAPRNDDIGREQRRATGSWKAPPQERVASRLPTTSRRITSVS